MKKDISKNQLVIYQTKTGAIELKGDFAQETVWATQTQIAEVFSTERSVVTKHIRNILKDQEVNEVTDHPPQGRWLWKRPAQAGFFVVVKREAC